jgi:hypothetical protein
MPWGWVFPEGTKEYDRIIDLGYARYRMLVFMDANRHVRVNPGGNELG